MGAFVAKVIDLSQALRPHKRKIYRYPKGHKRLVGAYIGCRLLAAYMLLACLKSKHKAPASLRICGLADDSSRQLSHILGLAGHKANIRTSVAKRNSERLSVAYRKVRAPLGRALDHGKRARIAVLDEQGSSLVNGFGEAAMVLHYSETVHARNQHSSD